MEEALYDSVSMRRFVGIDLGEMPVPDESTVCRFRHLLEAQGLGEKLFQRVHRYLERQGIKIGTGTIVDATIISASPSTKNKDKRRDPEMRQTKKGNQWYFGMKAHIGVDSQTRVIHSVVATPANVHDSACLPELSHGKEARVWGDSAYQGQSEVIHKYAPKATDSTNRRYRYKSGVDTSGGALRPGHPGGAAQRWRHRPKRPRSRRLGRLKGPKHPASWTDGSRP